jgi:hypothetical protein
MSEVIVHTDDKGARSYTPKRIDTKPMREQQPPLYNGGHLTAECSFKIGENYPACPMCFKIRMFMLGKIDA